MVFQCVACVVSFHSRGMESRDLQAMRPGRWGKSFIRPTGRAVSGRGNWRRPELPKKDLESGGPREPGGVEPGSLSGNGTLVPLLRTCQPASCVRHPPGTSCSPTAVTDQRPKPPHPTPAGPRRAHSLGEAEGTMTTLPQRGEGWARGAGKTLALLCNSPSPQVALRTQSER